MLFAIINILPINKLHYYRSIIYCETHANLWLHFRSKI